MEEIYHRRRIARSSTEVTRMEGTRSILVDIQALAFWASFPHLRRIANGFDPSRLYVRLAVETFKPSLSNNSRYLTVVGAYRIEESLQTLLLFCVLSQVDVKFCVRTDRNFPRKIGLCQLVSFCNLKSRFLKAEMSLRFHTFKRITKHTLFHVLCFKIP